MKRHSLLLLILTAGITIIAVGMMAAQFHAGVSGNTTTMPRQGLSLLHGPAAALKRAAARTERTGRAGQPGHALAVGPINDSAYQELTNRVTFNQGGFYVYLDEDSGFNHGFPSGFFGTTSAITIDPGCIDDANDMVTGCFPATDTSALDTTRGTVLRVSFAGLPPSQQFAGLNIEEPQDWGVLQSGLGYDLTGASNIVFDVRSPGGSTVQFGVGPCVTGYMTIPQTWTTMTIPLSSLVPGTGPCPPVLSSVHVLFSVATNDVHDVSGATVLLDNIHFTPVPARVSQGAETLSLPFDTQTFGVVPQLSSFPPDQVNRNIASIYEAALTLLNLLSRGQAADLTNAQEIANALDYALNHDNHGDPLPVAPDGSAGLHNAYESGDIALLNDQQPPAGGKAGDVRLAGFTVPTTPPSFDLVLDGATGGNNAFAILALGAAYLQFNDVTYLNDARTIAQWIEGNLTDTTGTGYGGYYLGYPDMGVPPPKPLIQGKSTENCADIYAAFSLLAAIDSPNASRWTTDANVAGDFVISMFDSANGRFYAGTVTQADAHNPGPGVCPDFSLAKGNDVVNTCDFLDSNSFTTLAMAGSQQYRSAIDWTEPIQYILNTFPQSITAGGLTYLGFDLVSMPISGNNGVAWEFTGQAVEGCNYLDALLGVTTFQSCAQTYPGQILQAQSSAPFGDGLGVVASTLDGENPPPNNLPPAEECLNTPFQCIPERVGLAATNWAILQDQAVNPFFLYPTVTLTPASLTFATQVVGTSSPAQPVTLTNIGSTALTITSITVTGNNSGDFTETNTCGTSLAPEASCTVNVTFTPTATGTRSGTLTVTDNNNGESGAIQTASLTGTGAAPVVMLSPPSLPAFASTQVGTTSAAQAVTLTNTGSAALTVSGITLGGTNAGDYAETNSCGASVAAAGSCTINVTFTPTATGSRTATLMITDNANGVSGSTQTLALAGTGTAPAAALSPASLSFSNQNVGTASTVKDVTITNSGTAALSITSIAVGGTNAADFSETNACGTSLAAGASCSVMVTFKPAAIGSRTGTLTVTDNATGSPQTAALSGTGSGATAGVSPASLAFPAQLAKSTSSGQTVTITNGGNADLSFTKISASGDFAVAASGTTCSTTTPVAASKTCTVQVTFTPTAGGARSGSLTLDDTAVGSASQTVSLAGTGEDFTLAAGPGGSTATVSAGQTATYSLTLTPQGGFSLAVTLACAFAAPQPVGTTCTVSPSTLTPSGTSGTTVTVSASTTAGLLPGPRWPMGPTPQEWLWMLLFLTALGIVADSGPVRRRRVGAGLAALALLAALAVGCGGGGNSVTPPPPNPTPPGTYNLMLTATSGVLTQTEQLTLKVQ